jgi:large subunit ribosomal protein L18
MVKMSSGAVRRARHSRIRKTVKGTADRPRLCVFRSLQHIYCQVIDDTRGHTLASASTLENEAEKTAGVKKSVEAEAVGTRVAERALQAGVTQVVFDRGGFKYHGRVKNLAEAARKAGLKF